MLAIRALEVSYGNKKVLEDIYLGVEPGEVFALIGPNGAGKSTLVKSVSGLLPIQKGEITYDQQNLLKLTPSERARILAVVPQARQLGGAFTVEQTVLMGRTAYMNWLGQAKEEDIFYVQRALKATSTEKLAQRRIAELSGGEQQRVLLARALAQNAPLLILDEPTNHLDLQHQSAILTLVRSYANENQLAVLMALHDLNNVAMYADKVALIVAGRILAFGSPQEVLTAERISEAYQTPIQVIQHPESQYPIILPKPN